MITRRDIMTGIMPALVGFGTDGYGASTYGGGTGPVTTRTRIYWYAASYGAHPRHPNSIRVVAQILSAGGSGMGSRPNMSFTQSELPIAYAMYGRKGNPSCWDTYPARTCTATDGETFSWPNNPFYPVWDNPVFVTSNQAQLWFVHGPTLTQNTFKLSQYPYAAPGVTTPYAPQNWGGPVTLELNAYRYAVQGGNGGGVIGDQAIAGGVNGFYSEQPYPSSIYKYGSEGQNMLGAGGCGGGSPWGGGGAPQIGGSQGNAGTNLLGGGGSGAGFMNPDGSYPISQWGPGGGAGGSLGEIECDLKPFYYFNAGAAVAGGNAGAGGFKGGDSGHGVIIVREFFV